MHHQPKEGDLVYGIDHENGRRSFLRRNQGCQTIDQYDVTGAVSDVTVGSENATRKDAALDELIAALGQQKGAPAKGSSDPQEIRNANARRKCKMGIQWAAKNKRIVHFILDGLDIGAVINKTYQRETSESRSITGSELRWIYRHRNDQDIMDHVQFWYNGTQVPPLG